MSVSTLMEPNSSAAATTDTSNSGTLRLVSLCTCTYSIVCTYVCIYHVCYHRLYIHTRNGLAMPRYIVYVTSLGFLRTVTARGKLAGVTNDKLL